MSCRVTNGYNYYINLGADEAVIVKSYYGGDHRNMIFVFTSTPLISLRQRCPLL